MTPAAETLSKLCEHSRHAFALQPVSSVTLYDYTMTMSSLEIYSFQQDYQNERLRSMFWSCRCEKACFTHTASRPRQSSPGRCGRSSRGSSEIPPLQKSVNSPRRPDGSRKGSGGTSNPEALRFLSPTGYRAVDAMCRIALGATLSDSFSTLQRREYTI